MPRKSCVAACRLAAEPALITVFCNEGRYDRSNVVFSKGMVDLYEKGSNRRAGVTSTME
jgi:hypothetical protein